MDTTILAPIDQGSIYPHVRVLLGMIIGLGLTHLLRHIARIIEHPNHKRVYWIHLLWVLSVFLFLLHFWWWELRLSALREWTFNLYLFVALYALLLYLLCVFILPDNIDEYADYRDYFYSRRLWFFGTLALIYVVDFADTTVKGHDYLEQFGYEYPLRNIIHVVACLIAIATMRAWYHAAFVIAAVIYQLSWIVRQFEIV